MDDAFGSFGRSAGAVQNQIQGTGSAALDGGHQPLHVLVRNGYERFGALRHPLQPARCVENRVTARMARECGEVLAADLIEAAATHRVVGRGIDLSEDIVPARHRLLPSGGPSRTVASETQAYV